MPPKALILFAPGTNRDLDAAQAFELAGALPEVVHLNQLRRGERRWQDYQLLVLPGGFSYADALGAGKLLALELQHDFAGPIAEFVASGKPVIGICNGFQALVKSGLLPDPQKAAAAPEATLTFNACGHFECRWVRMLPVSQTCLWTRGLDQVIDCPIAHGEGNFQARDPQFIDTLVAAGQAALLYAGPDGNPARGAYPYNPNGSAADIAGICNPVGNVLGLMPHPENHIFAEQHPLFTRGQARGTGLSLFRNGVKAANQF
ncbi:phosphoribosylformylglycinamidine synthase subunit I [Longilinea arvoryzae]|uniref:Phosphoribosylformylglycinamidine synthase subunit I n=1 Tax=Longilinea arvoryzae TaxID=360412 RepID=A0A0S7BHI4_9CHLR|nr:phosphoribosylformylglycinamidine synthase I [Longilinea arvoryzae]GAP12954.1 phosphoribosylformylglycinamidine synthase subunit I [Longilinea arvoryzae]